MALIKSMNVDPEIVNKTQCDMNRTSLSGEATCNAEPFVDRDVEFLRCRNKRSCAFKRKYQGQLICTCPVNRASFGFN